MYLVTLPTTISLYYHGGDPGRHQAGHSNPRKHLLGGVGGAILRYLHPNRFENRQPLASEVQSTSKEEPPAIKPSHSAAHGQVVTPWDVQGSVSADGKQMAIDYDKLIDQFGTGRIDKALLERFERLTGRKPHILLRRGMFFSHRSVVVFTKYCVHN